MDLLKSAAALVFIIGAAAVAVWFWDEALQHLTRIGFILT